MDERNAAIAVAYIKLWKLAASGTVEEVLKIQNSRRGSGPAGICTNSRKNSRKTRSRTGRRVRARRCTSAERVEKFARERKSVDHGRSSLEKNSIWTRRTFHQPDGNARTILVRFSWQRLRHVAKEFIQMRRDRLTFAMSLAFR